MRLSVSDLHEYDEEKLALCRRVVILVDGVQVKNCTEADEEEGFVTRFRTYENGEPIILPGTESGKTIETETLYGNVQIIDPLEKMS